MERIKPIQLAYNTFEPAHGVKNESPVIFLHGITSFKEFWYDIPQIVADTTNRKVYALDSRNHGDSEWSDEFNFDSHVVDLLHFMDHIKAHKVVLVGHSLGGLFSMSAAQKVPERIEKIVVEDMIVLRDLKQIKELVLFIINMVQTSVELIPSGSSMENAKKLLVDNFFNYQTENTKCKLSGSYYPLKQNPDGSYSWKANMKLLEDTFKDSQPLPVELKGTYNGPACFIYGKKSPFLVYQNEELIKRYFPNAKLIDIDDASHYVHVDSPGPFKEALLEFLKN